MSTIAIQPQRVTPATVTKGAILALRTDINSANANGGLPERLIYIHGDRRFLPDEKQLDERMQRQDGVFSKPVSASYFILSPDGDTYVKETSKSGGGLGSISFNVGSGENLGLVLVDPKIKRKLDFYTYDTEV